MRKIFRTFTAAACLPLLLAACAGNPEPAPEITRPETKPLIDSGIDDGGTGIVGPAAGILLGSTIGSGGGTKAAVIAGALVGYSLSGSDGPAIQGSMKTPYRNAMRELMDAPIGTRVTWQAPGEKARGTLWVTEDFTDEDGRPCRRFQEERQVRGRKGHLSGIACPAG